MLKFSPENVKRVADKEIEAARKYRDGCVAHFRKEPDMVAMFRDDCNTRVKAARLAKKGQYREALETARNQDTAARDQVTEEFWNLMEELTQEVVA